MPFTIRKVGDKYQVITEGTDHVHGTFDTKAKAREQQKALYVNVPDASRRPR